MKVEKATSSNSGGIGFIGLLTIVFVALKLMGYIDWGWIWVLAPIWIGLILGFIFLAIALIILVVTNRKGW